MELKNIPVYNARQFTWHGLEGACDVSDLNGEDPWSRIWDDAYDVGFKVVGTHSTKLFTCKGCEKDMAGEILSWCFVEYTGFNVDDKPILIQVFND